MKTTVDPRQARSRKAMLDAARELLAREGPAAVTHQRVARQAGVGRATVYRHWPRPEQLIYAITLLQEKIQKSRGTVRQVLNLS